MPFVSVIVPVYKVEPYIRRCVDSILAQTYTDFELILVDDGSPDNCGKICDEYAEKDKRIHVIHQENGGLSAARNSGIEWTFKNSDSEWITFIDSDDWVHPEYISLLLYCANKYNSPISMCQMNFCEDYRINELTGAECQLREVEEAYEDGSLDPNSSCARLYKREMFRNIKFPQGKLHEDRFTTYKLLFQCKKMPVVCEQLYYYFMNSDGIVHSEWTLRRLDDVEATENQLEYFEKNGFERAYMYTLKNYVQLLIYSLKKMKGKYPEEIKDVRKKLVTIVTEKKDVLGLNWRKNFNIYKYAYPVRAKIYRRLVNLVGIKV